MIRVSFDVTEAQFENLTKESVYLSVFGAVRSTDTTAALLDSTGRAVQWSGSAL